jgi:hypothetical protein
VAILASSWGVTGGLFALIAAITAVLLNLATDIANRSRLIREYRRRGFDAVAFMSLFVLVWTGWVVLNVAALQARNGEIEFAAVRFQVESWASLVLWDIVGLAWLLIYSHLLLGQSPEQQKQAIRNALKVAFREDAVLRVSSDLLDAWAAQHGLETRLMAGFSSAGSPVFSPRGGNVFDVDLGMLSRILASFTNHLHGNTRAQFGVTLGRDVPSGAQIACVPPDDSARGTGLVRTLIWK